MFLLLCLLAGDVEALYRQGVELFLKGSPREAIEKLSRATAGDAKHAPAWKALGVAHASMGNHDLAAEPFELACRLNPTLEDACFFHARNLYARNLFEPSIAALDKAAPIDKKPWRISHARAQALDALGRAAVAEKAFQQSIRQSDPIVVRLEDEPRLSYGIFLVRQGRTAEAIPWLESAIQRHQKSAKAHFELGRALYQLERLNEAAGRLQEAIKLDSTHDATRLLLDKTQRRIKAQ